MKAYAKILPVFIAVAAYGVVALSFSACSGKSEEDLIRETVNHIGDGAENRNPDLILSYLSADYEDPEGRTRDDVKELLHTYFSRYRGIVVNTLGTQVNYIKLPGAQVEIDVALSSGAAKIFRKAVRYAGEFYRFKVEMIKEGEVWRCQSAEWESITLQELFPESAKIMRKLFPDLF